MQLRSPHAAALVAFASLSLASAADAYAANACIEANQEAQDLRDKGRFREARAQLLVCAQKSCNAVIRNDCEKWLKELDEKTPTVIVRVVDARGQDVLGARVTIDGARVELDGKPVSVDPGQRTIKARARSGDVAEAKVLTAQGEKDRVVEVKFTTELTAEGTPAVAPSGEGDKRPDKDKDRVEESPRPVLPITLAAVGAVAAGAFVFFEITGHSDYGDLEDGCAKQPRGCSDAEIDPVKSKFVAAGISLGVSVVALGAAAIVYFMRPKAADTALRFSPVIRF